MLGCGRGEYFTLLAKPENKDLHFHHLRYTFARLFFRMGEAPCPKTEDGLILRDEWHNGRAECVALAKLCHNPDPRARHRLVNRFFIPYD